MAVPCQSQRSYCTDGGIPYNMFYFCTIGKPVVCQRLLLSPEFAQAGHLVKSYPESSGKAAGGVV